jgi:hypothetical protein
MLYLIDGKPDSIALSGFLHMGMPIPYVRYLLFLHPAMLVLKYKTVGYSFYLDARKGSAFYSDQRLVSSTIC